MSLPAFTEAFTQLVLDAASLTAADVPLLSRPFLWWSEARLTFEDLEHQIRGVMARLLALLSLHAPPPGKRVSWTLETLRSGVDFIDGYVDRHEVVVAETSNPARTLRDACACANALLDTDPAPLLDRVPPMREFHAAWRGILPTELINLDDRAAMARLDEACSDLVATENFVYTIVRKSGRKWLPAIEALLPRLLPADQLLWLHALDAFPRDPEVIALYERVVAAGRSKHVQERIEKYLERVRSGVVTTGYEIDS